jgi:NADPH-dependent curcumin reductase CurA
MPAPNRSVILRSRPVGLPTAEDFAVREGPVPTVGPGSLLVRVFDCSIDPAMRRWMDADSYGVPIPVGGVIPCMVVGRVTQSRCDGFAAGQLVTGRGAVADHVVMQPDGYTRLVDTIGLPSLSCHLSVLGTSGLTAYNGLLKIGHPVAGETVLVSAAAGSVGSLVGQIARIHGCRAVGIAGGPTKCRRLLDAYGFDAAIDYHGKDLDALARDLHGTCPDGVDVYFDNVGGLCLEAALSAINWKARIVLCGMVSLYNATELPPGPRNLWQLVARAATMHGFLNREYLADCSAELRELRRWIAEGRLTWREHVEEGLENFHRAFLRLFDGSNEGKLILRVAPVD